MTFNLDKRVFEILRDQGINITWEQFRAAYVLRQEERRSAEATTQGKTIK